MKFRRSAAITILIYFLFTSLWMALSINASTEDENSHNIPELVDNILTQELQQDTLQLPAVNATTFFHSIKAHIFSKILNEFITIHDILRLRKTCIDFKILLFPNDTNNMVMFCKHFGKKEDLLPLLWLDLKYFLNQSYTNALENMQMFNLKHNQYAVVTRDKKIISWHTDNEQALNSYPRIIFNKIANEISQPSLDYEPPRLYNKNETSWARITNKGNVLTGGDERGGGNSEPIQSQLKNVKTIVATCDAFAALLHDGSVIAWGGEKTGGKISEPIQAQLQNVKTIFSSSFAFAALLQDGSVVAWGDEKTGGKISEPIQSQLKNVKTIFSNFSDMFVALLKDDSVIIWGDKNYEAIQLQLKNVKTIVTSCDAFAALLHNGSVVAWRDEDSEDQNYEAIQFQLKKVNMIVASYGAFAALLHDGSVVAWGDEGSGSKIPEPIQFQLKNVKAIVSNDFAFAALLHDGSVVAWGDNLQGGKIPHEIQIQLNQNVNMIFSNDNAFVALLNNGRFVAWGNAQSGGKITDEIQTKLENVKVIFSSFNAFSAILDNGSVFAWGDEEYGGRIPEEIESKLINNHAKMIFPQNGYGFMVLCKNGEMFSWW